MTTTTWSSTSAMIVSYDPSAGFVTGGGWIQSAAGAYKPDLAAQWPGDLRVRLEIQKGAGATAPTGNTEFQFQAGGMNFHSTSSVAPREPGRHQRAVQGNRDHQRPGSYTFMLWATDNGNAGDTFRIQITETTTVERPFTTTVFRLIGGGSIVIHKSGKK